ncbi:MAG: peptide ABC transporter substrate-binding protein [Anaerolineae bacterium]|nr:peptide ABC transporter substrate-binding protein [Anaerolineae bacterium]
MRMQRLLILLLVAVLLLPAALPVGAQTKAVTIAYTQELDTLNPMYSVMFFVGTTRDLYLLGAWTFDDELQPTPRLVTEIPSQENGGLNEDGTVLTMTLRNDIFWSDGEPITSADFVFTYEMIMADGNAPVTRFPYEDFVTSVEAPDDQTVVVNFREPFAPWLSTIFTYVLPEHVLAPVFEAEGTIDNAEWNRAPSVSSGPFMFDEWEVGSFIRFVRNENYFLGTPNLEVVVVQFIPDDVSYVLAIANEDVDIGTFFGYSDIEQIEEFGGNVVETLPSGFNEAWFFNVNPATAHPAMLDIRVRQALAMGFNRQQITEDLLLGRTYPADSYWENTPYESPNAQAPAYDPEMAAQLLDETGWVDSDGDGIRDMDGEPLSLRYITNTRAIRGEVQVVAQQQLGDLGVELLLEQYPSDVYFNGYAQEGPMARGQYDIAQLSTAPSFPDPNTSRFLCSEIPSDEQPAGGNWYGLCVEELDALFTQQAAAVDFNERVAVFHQIDDLLNEQFVWVSIWHDPDLWSYNVRIQNIALNGVTPFWNAHEWDV